MVWFDQGGYLSGCDEVEHHEKEAFRAGEIEKDWAGIEIRAHFLEYKHIHSHLESRTPAGAFHSCLHADTRFHGIFQVSENIQKKMLNMRTLDVVPLLKGRIQRGCALFNPIATTDLTQPCNQTPI